MEASSYRKEFGILGAKSSPRGANSFLYVYIFLDYVLQGSKQEISKMAKKKMQMYSPTLNRSG